MRARLIVVFGLLAHCWGAGAQDADLVVNGGFEEGVAGWHLVLGGYGQRPPRVGRDALRARAVSRGAHAGRQALLLDAVGLSHEVDAYSVPMPVQPGYAYRLRAFVRQTAGTEGYKVTLDWQTPAGEHLAYANDWRGSNRPKSYQPHGGVFVAPEKAGRVVIILGVQRGTRCFFDDVSLVELGRAEPLNARPRRDGDGQATIEGPARVDAWGHATWRVVYTCGSSGLPCGGAIVLRRWPVSFDWSPPQTDRPKASGFVSAQASGGALFEVSPGQMQEVIVRVAWPALQPGERVEIIVGDRSGGGPGMRVQGKPASARWIVASDCTADGEYRDLAQTSGGAFQIVPGPAVRAWVMAPAVAESGQSATLQVEARDAVGNVTDRYAGRCLLQCTPPEAELPRVVRFAPGAPARRNVRVAWRHPGLHTITATLPDARQNAPAQTAWVAVSRPVPHPPAGPVQGARAVVNPNGALLYNGHVALVFARNEGPQPWGAARLLVRDGQAWRSAAAIPGIGRAAFAGARPGPVPGDLFAAATAHAQQSGSEAVLVLRGAIPVPGETARWTFTARFGLEPDARGVSFRLTVQPAGRRGLVALHAPLLYPGDGTTGSTKAGALFPGVEFLAGEEVSSDDDGVAWSIRERWIPHPYKITVPLMAVAAGKQVVGLAWNPVPPVRSAGPAATRPGARLAGLLPRVPAAHFASPNRREEKPNHLMALVLPGLTAAFRENVAGPASGWVPPAGAALSLDAEIFALGGSSDVVDAVRHWVRTRPLPAARPPRPPREALALCARGLLETAYDPQSQGWITAVGWKHGFHPDVANTLLQAAFASGDQVLAQRAAAQVDAAIQAAGGPRGAVLQLTRGDAEAAVAELRGAAAGFIAKQRSDGSWRYADVYSTEGTKATLAQPDDVELGTCVNALESVLAYACATGDPEAIAAGVRGLEYVRRFSKPAGSESWEVPLVCPNLRAAALACRCFLRGWQLTGRDEYLRLAQRWAWAGLAFIYLWGAPDRPAMPGASISVMGTTFYTHPWFGAAVQWVGLVYAEVLHEFAAYDRSCDWRRVAELITASALHQQKTAAAPCRHVGFYPDSFSLVKGADYYEWCLAPTGIASNLLGLMGHTPGITVQALPAGQERVHVLSAAPVTDWQWDEASRQARLRLRALPAGSPSQVVIFGLSHPSQVTWNGSPLPRQDGGAPGSSAWWPAPTESALVFRLAWTEEMGELVLQGASPAPYAPPRLPTQVTNGGFEEGARGWACEPAAQLDGRDPHSGQAALLISAPDPEREGQAHSSLLRVEAGRRYRLHAWVMQVEGDGDYKVTVEWCGPGGAHLAYANDWAGTNRPRTYQEHGGVFEAPPGATAARIILGCRGARCLFDDISLEPAD